MESEIFSYLSCWPLRFIMSCFFLLSWGVYFIARHTGQLYFYFGAECWSGLSTQHRSVDFGLRSESLGHSSSGLGQEDLDAATPCW